MSTAHLFCRRVTAVCLLASALVAGGSTLAVAATARTAVVATCDDRYLSVSMGTPNGAAGTAFQDVVIVNAAARACTLKGFATVQFIWGAGTKPAAREVHDTGANGRVMIPRLIVLRPGGVASFVITYGDFATSSSPTCTVRSIRVMLPPVTRLSTVYTFAQSMALCGERHVVGVSPIEAGPSAEW